MKEIDLSRAVPDTEQRESRSYRDKKCLVLVGLDDVRHPPSAKVLVDHECQMYHVGLGLVVLDEAQGAKWCEPTTGHDLVNVLRKHFALARLDVGDGCRHCHGEGRRKHFAHRSGGVCFMCAGTGHSFQFRQQFSAKQARRATMARADKR